MADRLEAYGGRILRVDLTTRRTETQPLGARWIRDVIGGRAANTKRLAEELDPAADPRTLETIARFLERQDWLLSRVSVR